MQTNSNNERLKPSVCSLCVCIMLPCVLLKFPHKQQNEIANTSQDYVTSLQVNSVLGGRKCEIILVWFCFFSVLIA